MKKLPNGVIAYYPSEFMQKIIAVLLVITGIAIMSPLCPNKDGQMWLIALMLLAGGGSMVWESFFQVICFLYPDRIEWYSRPFVRYKKHILVWEEITGFYLSEKTIKRGKDYRRVKVLNLQTADGSEPAQIIRFYALSKKDRDHLLNELRIRGIVQGKDQEE